MSDPFLTGLIDYVRGMSDEAILALVRDKVGAWNMVSASAPAARAARRAAPAAVATAPKAAAPKKKAKRPAARRDSGAREQLLEQVEKAVKASKGLSASEVAKAVGVGQPRVAGALRELKLKKRIYQGGDRRFARYAGEAKAAEQASLDARRNASGPVKKAPVRAKKKG